MKSQGSVKRKIKTITSIKKVTKATAAIANIRLQSLSSALLAMKPYQESLAESAADIAGHLDRDLLEPAVPFFRKSRISKVLFIVFSSDKGLCGAYNSRLLSEVAEATRYQIRLGRKLSFISFGRHACEYLSNMKRSIVRSYPAVCLSAAADLARELTIECSSMFSSKSVDEVHIFYNRFLSAGRQKAHSSTFLPLDFSTAHTEEKAADTAVEAGIMDETPGGKYKIANFEIDGPPVETLFPFYLHYLEMLMRRVILESAAGEQAARMSAMQESTSNADDLIKHLSMKYNRMRQTHITGELIEVVSSAEALN